MLLASILTLTISVLLPVVALATVVLLPWADRPTQALQIVTYLSLVATVVYV